MPTMFDTDTGQYSDSNEFGVRLHDEAMKHAQYVADLAAQSIKNAQAKNSYALNPGQVGGALNYQSPSTAYQPPKTAVTQNPIQNVPINNQPEVPPWKPPVQMPQQDQGQLFQNNNQGGESMVPSWKPPTQMANPMGIGQVSPSMGTMGIGNNQMNRYQSPSTRYARNQVTF